MTYERANEQLTGRCAQRRKIGNNTYLERRNADIAVRLHNTDIVLFKQNGDAVLNTDGWKTVTTKARLNEYIRNFRIWSKRGVWYLSDGKREYPFADGITLHADGTVEGIGEDPQGMNRLRKRIAKYVAAYLDAMERGEVEAPSAGDCFYCQMRAVRDGRTLGESFQDSSHIESHMEESYFVPSLLARVVEVMPFSQVMKWWIGAAWDTSASQAERETARRASGDWAKQQIAKAMRRYILRQCGVRS